MRTASTLWLSTVLACSTLHARIDLLLVPPTGPVAGQPGTEFTLYLNNPTEVPETSHLPSELIAQYSTPSGQGRIRLALVNPTDHARAVPAMSRQTILLRLDEPIPGGGEFVSLRLLNPATNAIMFELAPRVARVPGSPAAQPEPAPAASPVSPGRNIDVTSDIDNMRRHVSNYDPIYFAVGWRERFNARFQFSFKYRVFERGPPGESWVQQLARDLYGAYTQTSTWDLDGLSKPFYDSSYKPTVFLLHEFDSGALHNWSFSVQAGAQHESNGKGGGDAADSRSFDTLYIAPKLRWTADHDFFIEARLLASTFYAKDENPDIARYRGHVELTVRTGYDRGFQFSAHTRGSFNGHGSIELNMTWPATQTPLLKLIVPPSLGGYAQVQYFNGYGESLLDYNVRRKDQLRFGLTLVR